jgi:hypothetical protein
MPRVLPHLLCWYIPAAVRETTALVETTVVEGYL